AGRLALALRAVPLPCPRARYDPRDQMTPQAVAVEWLSLSVGHFHLRKIDFVLSDGEILVILGPNGAGKSVILETIAGFHRPSAGRVVINGRDVTQLPPERR